MNPLISAKRIVTSSILLKYYSIFFINKITLDLNHLGTKFDNYFILIHLLYLKALNKVILNYKFTNFSNFIGLINFKILS